MALNIKYVFIKKEYFEDHPNLIELIDKYEDIDKLSARTHLHIQVTIDEYTIYLPMRKFLNVEKYGKIGFPIPSDSRPKAGIDYRKMLLIDDDKYIEELTEVKVSRRQINAISNNFSTIQEEVKDFINGYITEYKDGNIDTSTKYRYSTLKNFNSILDL